MSNIAQFMPASIKVLKKVAIDELQPPRNGGGELIANAEQPGLCPQLSGDSTQALDGEGNWTDLAKRMALFMGA